MHDTILIVDENPGMRRTLKKFLAQNGYSVVALDSIKSAIRYTNQPTPSLVIIDIKMPRHDGLEFIRMLRESNNSLPIIVMTAYPTFLTEEDAMKMGVSAYVVKPFEPFEIIRYVRQLCPCETKTQRCFLS